ncbi:hypothetical protein LOTGIDRAFT_188441 [Lottia gigantea]|uniref:procollagen-lysine 5-dioxygenase n=1 Tax=Lottia gigantea TaxID=225164 RepID=V3ZW50_LOTGI|nr:hypothetical protein LOTGIDRAFT_188441 [Lottia gigantea]ESO95748.1 hypothetical protein LOTGIDRAFT_188441 [Lottia gigantea]
MTPYSAFVGLFLLMVKLVESTQNYDLLAVTVATEETDGFKRFMRSAKKYDINVKVLGLGEEWKGGDVANSAGGGQKVNILRQGLKEFKDKDDLVIMFVDSYDLVFSDDKQSILEKFKKFDANVIFSAEGYCWPDSSLRSQYPEVKQTEKRYLNSGGFIGLAKNLYDVVSYKTIKDSDDDQLYYTKIFLDKSLRSKHNIKLDTKSEIFQNLNGALGDTTLKFKGSKSYMYNVKTGTHPSIIHGNGPIKNEFNRLSNYLVDSWTVSSGCQACDEDTISLEGVKESDYPTVLIGIFIEHPTAFLREFFEDILNLAYPKSKIDLYIHNWESHHRKLVEKFINEHKLDYNSLTSISPFDDVDEIKGRDRAIDECIKKNCQYYLAVDSDAHLSNAYTLQSLIEQNRSIIAPMLSRDGRLWSNFWGALNKDGFYARAEDYVDIVERRKIGVWNSPFISSVFLIHGFRLPALRNSHGKPNIDPDMAFSQAARDKGIFMYVSNRQVFGHLINSDNYDTDHNTDELFQIFDNPSDWERRYIHEDYYKNFDAGVVAEQPCPDVYWFPIVSPEFCQTFIDEMESYGQWSGGKNSDPRLAGGYENVPTVDIHMNQVGLERQWLHFLQKYVSPLQLSVFTGYVHDPPTAIMNFIVRYKPDEQPLLRPHHDSSTFTINIALNTPGVDFEGGGCRFIRYNCSVTATRKGWLLMHPGRLTHYHEGLRVTKGTRYIMISFVDP